MKLNFTTGLVLLILGIFVTPAAVLSYRALNSPPEPMPTTQTRLVDSPLARIPYLPPNSISGKPNKPTPEPATVDWRDVTNKPAGFADNLDNDVLGGLSCEIEQLARWNGSAWECFLQDLDALEGRVAALESLHVPTPTPTFTPTPEPPPAGLVGWWPGNGNANDVVGGNHGTLVGGYGAGKVGQGFLFDGIDDFVLVEDSPVLNITGDITILLWAKRTVFSGDWSAMAAKGGSFVGGVDVPQTYNLFFDPWNHLRGDIEQANGSDMDIVGPAVNDSDFHHYGYVRSDSSHKIFIDGVVVNELVFSGTPGSSAGLPLAFGAMRSDTGPGGFDLHFGGIVDEVQVFKRALGDSEVKAVFDSSK